MANTLLKPLKRFDIKRLIFYSAGHVFVKIKKKLLQSDTNGIHV